MGILIWLCGFRTSDVKIQRNIIVVFSQSGWPELPPPWQGELHFIATFFTAEGMVAYKLLLRNYILYLSEILLYCNRIAKKKSRGQQHARLVK